MTALSITEPPLSITELVDERRGLFACLVVQWGARVDVDHDVYAGRRFERGDIFLPYSDLLDKGLLSVTKDHLAARELGQIVSAASDVHGMWALIKLGHAGRELVAAGHRDVSAEVDDDGRLSGLTLVTGGRPALPGARIFCTTPPSMIAMTADPWAGHWAPDGKWYGRKAPSDNPHTTTRF